MRFRDLVSRLDDESIQLLLGEAPMRLLQKLDPHLASPTRLREAAVRLHTPHGLLKSVEKRRILLDVLPEDRARTLAAVLGVSASSGESVHSALKRARFRTGSEREKDLFAFFELTRPALEVRDDAPSQRVAASTYPLFPHQRRAAREVDELLRSSKPRAILHMPTGAGKTRTAMNIVADHLREHEPTVVVWLAQTEELCEQAAEEFEQAWEALGNRPVSVYRYWGDRDTDPSGSLDGIWVAGLPKMYATVRQRIDFILSLARRASLVIIDEAHSAVATTYKLILDALVLTQQRPSGLLGLTATPGRTWSDIDVDEELAQLFFRQKVTLTVPGYSSPVDYLVDEGYLARAAYEPLFHGGGIHISASDIAGLQDQFDVPERILRQLGEDEARNAAIVAKTEELAKRHSRIIVFATSVAHSYLLATVLELRGLRTMAVTGATATTTRNDAIKQFKESSDQPMVLTNYGVLTTGFDAPRTSAAIIARPTKSLVLYSQMVGRAIRGPRAGGNTDAEIITVVDNELPGFRSVAEAFSNWEDIWE